MSCFKSVFYSFFFVFFLTSVLITSSVFPSVSMSSLCLSSVLTRANLTMYQTGVPDVLPQQSSVLPSINTLQITNPEFSSSISGKRHQMLL